MIIGYQVKNQHNMHWGNRPADLILTEETATADFKAARNAKIPNYNITAILLGEINNPIFENKLSSTTDQYKVLGVCTSHIYSDLIALEELANDVDCTMIAGRGTGWFVKLYDQATANLGYNGMSESFHHILTEAALAGYRMVEFDTDAIEHCEFSVSSN